MCYRTQGGTVYLAAQDWLTIPAIFPRAHTACSWTWDSGDDSNLTNLGTAPSDVKKKLRYYWTFKLEALFVSSLIKVKQFMG